MNNSTTGALLAHDKVDRYRSFGAFGKPAYQSHVQLRAMLKAKRGDKFANYFAKPTFDPDAGELRWTAELPGAARGWHEMSPEEQAQRALDLEVMRSGLMSFAQELRAQGGAQPGGAAAFASLLEQAMKVPAQGNFLYFVGDQPVIAFWGFEGPNGASVDPAAQAPRLATAAAALVPPAAPAPLPVEPVRRKRPWWWWLLWLLLALLLLALLLLLPRACTPAGGLDLKRAIPGLAPPDEAASMPRGESVPGPGGMALPGGEGGSPPAGTAPGADPALPGASQPGGLPNEPLAEPRPDMPPDAKQDPKTDTSPDANQDPKKDPKTDPPLDPRQDPKTDPPKPPTDPKRMKLPEEPNAQKKMDFLEGGWKAGEGLFDKQTQQPLDLSFKFGKDGQGEVALRRPDGTVCRGAVQGRMNGGKLGIEGSQSIPCSNGSSYGAPKIECQKERDGKTQCYGVNADGSRYYMDMQKR